MRSQLLLGILLPVGLLVAVNALSLYRQALSAADTAYDRTLLASAKSLGESLEIVGQGDAARVRATVPYSALEAFEADNRSRMFYKVSGFRGEWVSGFEDLPPWRGQLPAQGLYAALVHFYNDRYRDQAVRVAVLLQPVASAEGRGMATIQVAETLELRETLARRILFDTLWRQAALLAVIAGVVVWVVQHALQPVRRLSTALRERPPQALGPLPDADAPQELRPLLDATNHVMARLDELLGHQRRFVRDTAHQLRTPLAVLKTQVQSARRGDLPAEQALAEIDGTVARATTLANQMLSLAKVEQLRQQGVAPVEDWAPAAREVALDLAALVAERQLDFSIDTVAAPVRVHAWALRELTRNLLHNAIRHCPPGGPLAISLRREDGQAVLRLVDSGPGLAPGVGERLFQPFSTALSAGGHLPGGTGLGLAICRDIVDAAGGRIVLRNREDAAGAVLGLEACVQLPLADNPA
ncbi:sensor histidine kinase [Piscinibacter sakaiensis]|uniref:sensor histidine kinase n=1 Tax=Piscinibacter sakaiensis TaxID=1547922 RepID=UPI0006B65DCA|nr:sensor histidine kinase [Piscinibacter sakaiensis]